MRVPEAWYAVALSQDILHKPVGLKLLGNDLVFFRDLKYNLIVMDDRCPHRSAKLSLGQVINNTIACPFHGFRFDTKGQCVEAPEFDSPLPKLCSKTYITHESDGIIWLWHGSKSPTTKPEWFKDTVEKNKSSFREFWPCHFSRCIENQLDYAHLPFVHKNTIGRFARLGQKPQISYLNSAIKFSFTNNQQTHIKSNSYIEFRYPNIWINKINNKLAITLIFVPICENKTELILINYQSYIQAPILSSLANWVLKYMNKKILAEDRRVVLSQDPSDTSQASYEKLFANDILIKHFRSWLAETK